MVANPAQMARSFKELPLLFRSLAVVAQPGGYRFSVVYFSLKAAWQCLPFSDELARIKAKNTERSRALLGRNVYAGKKPELKRLVRERGEH